MSRFLRDYLAKANALVESGETFVSITLVLPEGHVPQDIGAKLIVTKSGIHCGTVGGGRLEARAIEHAQKILDSIANKTHDLKPELIRYDLKADLGMVCGGMASLFYEVFANKLWTIAVFGAGHVAQATVPVLAKISNNVVCIDTRKEWLDKIPNMPSITKILSDDLASATRTLPDDTFFVLMTQGHATDLPIALAVLKHRTPPYLGVIGSLPKSRTLKAALLQAGISESNVNLIKCPIGLAIGSNDPQEIAISIAAELLQMRDLG